MKGRGLQRGTGAWRTPTLDANASKLLAVVTLFTSGHPDDAAMAAHMLDEIVATPGGDADAINGLVGVCASLLVMLEFEASLPPAEALRRVGQLLAYAELPMEA